MIPGNLLNVNSQKLKLLLSLLRENV